MNKLALYCRSDFEKEVAAEITQKAADIGIFGFARVEEGKAFVIFECYQLGEADRLAREIKLSELIFARQIVVVSDLLTDLDSANRISPIVEQYQKLNTNIPLQNSQQLWVETPDTNQAKELSVFCRKFTVPLRQNLKQQGWLNYQGKAAITLHILFTKANHCYVGYSYNSNHNPHFMGIRRLKFPSNAPSRSTLKLEEAILTFIPATQEAHYFNENMYAVDLGACPGGWTYQLVKRGLFVYAVDHGKMAASLHDTGRIEHCEADGFKFQPPKHKKIQWLVCDMVEQPQRITRLIAKWLTNGWSKQCIFNLKLPMKKRYQEVQQCLDLLTELLQQHSLNFKLQAKHLYHDREEITVYVAID